MHGKREVVGWHQQRVSAFILKGTHASQTGTARAKANVSHFFAAGGTFIWEPTSLLANKCVCGIDRLGRLAGMGKGDEWHWHLARTGVMNGWGMGRGWHPRQKHVQKDETCSRICARPNCAQMNAIQSVCQCQ